jgi:hypothetical protein
MRKSVKVAAVAFGASAALGLATPAFASTIPSNFPGDTGISCNAWHGAPGGFGPESPYYTVAEPQGGVGGYTFGQRQGEITGQNNSGASVACNS